MYTPYDHMVFVCAHLSPFKRYLFADPFIPLDNMKVYYMFYIHTVIAFDHIPQNVSKNYHQRDKNII